MYQRNARLPAVGLSLLFVLCLITRPALAGDARQDSYPPPQATPAIDPLRGEPLLATPTLAAYPPNQPGLGEPGIGPATPAPIGIDSAGQIPAIDTADTATQVAPDSSRGLLYLWLGFIATLLILLTSVIGAIRLFTRRNEN